MNERIKLEELTRKVCEIAKQAGAYIREERRKFSLQNVERKHAHDYVSYVDKGSEEKIVCALRKLLPEAGFITEEGTTKVNESSSVERQSSDFIWVVDPLDGTTNFIHQYAPYAVSIALLHGKEVLVGVVYPIINHLISHFYGQVGSIRMCGSAAMALCYVASGRYDGYAEKYIGQWDFMAGALIVKEAGGMVTNYEGSDDFTQGNNVVATNGVIQPDLLNVIKTA